MKELVKITVRMDKTLEREIQTICFHNKVSRDAFLEAVCMTVQGQPELLKDILQITHQRHAERRTRASG